MPPKGSPLTGMLSGESVSVMPFTYASDGLQGLWATDPGSNDTYVAPAAAVAAAMAASI